MKYLLAAEADKIQSMIFRASRLQEIVGGSQMLSDWCADIAEEMRLSGISEEEIVVADGGAFRVIMPDLEQARNWAELLAESYYDRFGSTISVAEPVALTRDDFQAASQSAQTGLRLAKNRPAAAGQGLHNPFVAQCVVCGTGMVSEIRPGERGKRDAVCKACATRRRKGRNSFLGGFCAEVKLLGDFSEELQTTTDINKLAAFDTRANVAYLVADGNDMGVLFSQCSQSQTKELSTALGAAMRRALAAATAALIGRIDCEAANDQSRLTIPVLPLIAGGDDLLAVMATPYCLDVARFFAGAYRAEMVSLLQTMGLSAEPSLACGIVIAKGNYPHTLAYEKAKMYLQRAKAVARLRDRPQEKNLIACGFAKDELENAEQQHDYASLQPYDLTGSGAADLLPLAALLEARLLLSQVPVSRLSAIHELFDLPALPGYSERATWWLARLDFVLERAGRLPTDKAALLAALQRLGSDDPNRLYLRRAPHSLKYGSAISDLLDFWEYALELDRPKGDYAHEH